MDPTWLDQLLAYIKGPGLAHTAGLSGVAGAMNPGGSFANLPTMKSPSIVPAAKPIGIGQAGYTPGPLGVPQGSPYSGQTGVIPSGPATSPVQLPAPTQTRQMMPPNMGGMPATPTSPLGASGGAPGQPALGPGSQPYAQAGSALTGLAGLAKAFGVGGLLQALKPTPAQAPGAPQTGTPVTPLGPQPPASQTFMAPQGPPMPGGMANGPTPMPQADPRTQVPMPRPAPVPQSIPMPQADPRSAGVSPNLIQAFIQSLTKSPVLWNQQGQNTASGF